MKQYSEELQCHTSQLLRARAVSPAPLNPLLSRMGFLMPSRNVGGAAVRSRVGDFLKIIVSWLTNRLYQIGADDSCHHAKVKTQS